MAQIAPENNNKVVIKKWSKVPTVDDYTEANSHTKFSKPTIHSTLALKALENLFGRKEIQDEVPEGAVVPFYYYFNLMYSFPVKKQRTKEVQANMDETENRLLNEFNKDNAAYKKAKNDLTIEIPGAIKNLEHNQAKHIRFGDYYYDDYYHEDRIGGLSKGGYYLYDNDGYYDGNMAYLSPFGHENRAGNSYEISKANRVNADNYYSYGYYDNGYGGHDDTDMFEFYDGSRAGRFAGYGRAPRYYNTDGGRNQLYRSRQRGRNSYHRRGLQETEDFRDYMNSSLGIFLIVFLMAMICIFGAVFYNRYHKRNKSKKNVEDQMVMIQAKNGEENQV